MTLPLFSAVTPFVFLELINCYALVSIPNTIQVLLSISNREISHYIACILLTPYIIVKLCPVS